MADRWKWITSHSEGRFAATKHAGSIMDVYCDGPDCLTIAKFGRGRWQLWDFDKAIPLTPEVKTLRHAKTLYIMHRLAQGK